MLKYFLQQKSAKYQGMKQLYQQIHRHGPVTKAKLVENTEMKQTTVTRHLEYLLKEGFIRISEYEQSSGGRPPALFEIEPNAAYMIGIDLSRTESTVSLVNAAFEKIDQFTFQMTEFHTPEYTIQIIKEKIAVFLENHHLQKDDLLGIGVGTVGPLDREKGVILEPAGFIASGWQNVPLIDQLRNSKNEVILLENGANTATLYEYMQSNHQDQTILHCISGRGLRCGVLANGRILKTKAGDASSFGEMILDVTDRQSLSSLISYDYLLHETNKRYAKEKGKDFFHHRNKTRKQEQMEYFMQALEKDEPIAKGVLLDSAETYGMGLANMINILHPDKVVLSGELIHRFPSYYEKVTQTAKRYIYRIERKPVQFIQADRNESSISVGAAVLVFQTYFE